MLCMSELREYGEYLRDREMSENTVEKYLRDAENFLRFSEEREISRELMLEYKAYILDSCKISSANSMITAVNSYLKWQERRNSVFAPAEYRSRSFGRRAGSLERKNITGC